MSAKYYITCFLSTVIAMGLGIYAAATNKYWICALMLLIGISGVFIKAYIRTRKKIKKEA